MPPLSRSMRDAAPVSICSQDETIKASSSVVPTRLRTDDPPLLFLAPLAHNQPAQWPPSMSSAVWVISLKPLG